MCHEQVPCVCNSCANVKRNSKQKKFGINGCAFFYSVCARTRRRLIIKRGTAPFIYLFFIFLSFSYFVDAVKRRITPLSLPIGFFLCLLLGPRFMCRKRIEAQLLFIYFLFRLKITKLRMYIVYIYS